jgi:hypothetical protein
VTGGWDAFVRCRPVGRQGTLRSVLSSQKCPSSSAATYEAALRNNRVCVFCHSALCSLCLKVFLIGDGAYDGDSRVLVPYRGNDLDERQRRFNKVLRSERFLVEWVIGRVRTTWFVLAGSPVLVVACSLVATVHCARRRLLNGDSVWRWRVSRIEPTLRAACLLCNYLWRTRQSWPSRVEDHAAAPDAAAAGAAAAAPL